MGRVTTGGRVSLPALSLAGVTLAAAVGLPAGVGEEPTTGLLPTVTCERYGQLKAIDARMAPSEVFDLDRDDLAELQAERRRLVAQLADRTTGDLGAFLQDMTLWQASFDAALLDDWDAQRRRLAREGWTTWDWRRELVEDGEVRDPDGETVVYDDVGWYVSYIDQRLAVECHAPELVDGPPQDHSGDPPEGRLVYFRPDDRGFGGKGWIYTSEADGTGERRQMHRPYSPVGPLDVAPTPDEDGDHDVLAAVEDEDGRHGVAVLGPAGVLRRTGAWADVPRSCLNWDERGERFLVLDDAGDPDARFLHVVDPDRGADRLDLRFPAAGCADYVTGDRLVVPAATAPDADDLALWTVGVDGTDPEQLYAAEGCVTQVGGVDPAGERVAIAQSCIDVVSSGVLVVDLATGDATRVVTGYAALPKWSPDGEWLAFGLIPLGQREPVGVWIGRADGTGLRQVVEGPASFPAWLP